MKRYLALSGWVAVCLLIGGFGSLVTTPALPDWYAGLQKPTWNPPNWIFGPVWSTLYVLMGVAAWKVGSHHGHWLKQSALLLFGVQLTLNLLWSVLFFGARNPGGALAEIAVLWSAIAGTVALFRRVSPAAAWLIAPYLAWVSFAACLNFAIWRLN